MSCYACGTAFSLFKKELGCKNCGYAFCKNCLSKKAVIPKLDHEKHKVCLKCFKILTGEIQPAQNPAQYSPPGALVKRFAALENKNSRSSQAAASSTKPKSVPPPIDTRGLAKEDIDIARRLHNLKQKKQDTVSNEGKTKTDKNAAPSGPPPSDSDMAERLARLKGQNPTAASKPHVFVAERRPQTQQVDDLLQEICDEVEIDSHSIDPAADIQNRLNKLSGQPTPTSPDYENNMDKPDSKSQGKYTKNIPQVDDNFEGASGENLDWSDMNHLIRQVANELEVDADKAIQGLRKDDDLWRRVNKLKDKREKQDQVERKTSNTELPEEDEDEECEEEACKNIIKQLLEESRLDEEMEQDELLVGKLSATPRIPGVGASTNKDKDRSESDSDELPWCCMCNRDASLRCLGCDGDLYCKRCYKEGHDRADYADHQTKPYKSPAK